MKKLFVAFCFGFFLFSLSANIFAQNKEVTIILLRHAEKDLSGGAEDPDPPLSTQGVERSRRLVETIEKYNPQAIFSSKFIRTKTTVTPLADSIIPGYRTQILFYDHRKLDELAKKMLDSDFKTIVVAGHNTTTPALANMLIGENKYKPLGEDEYDKIWVIKIKRNKNKPNKIEARVITY